MSTEKIPREPGSPAAVEIVAVLVDGTLTPRPSREMRPYLPHDLPGHSQAFTADGRVLTIAPEEARELARRLKGHRSIWVETR